MSLVILGQHVKVIYFSGASKFRELDTTGKAFYNRRCMWDRKGNL